MCGVDAISSTVAFLSCETEPKLFKTDLTFAGPIPGTSVRTVEMSRLRVER